MPTDHSTSLGTQESTARVAIVSTPRSGNTWLRGLLGRAFALQERAYHRPDDIEWDSLPDRFVMQIHWRRVEPFVSLLDRYGFRVVALARHPLDVLISALNYNGYTHSRETCQEGPPCASCSILGATPRSEEFLRYACNATPDHILRYSLEWWDVPGVVQVRYLDLVNRPVETMERLAADLGLHGPSAIAEAVAEFDIANRRSQVDVWHYHYWQGRPGLWRQLIVANDARRIAAAHRDVFERLGYDCDPDKALSDAEADLNWARLQHESLRQHLRDEQAKHRRTRGELDALRRRFTEGEGVAALSPRLVDFVPDEPDPSVAELRSRLAATHQMLTDVWARLAIVESDRLETRDRLAKAERALEDALRWRRSLATILRPHLAVSAFARKLGARREQQSRFLSPTSARGEEEA
jgi:hypothetical protein